MVLHATQKRLECPVSWGVLMSMAYFLGTKVHCIITDCSGSGNGKMLFQTVILCLWAVSIFFFIPIITLLSNGLKWAVNVPGFAVHHHQPWYPTAGCLIFQVLSGVLGGSIIFWLLDVWRERGLCMAQFTCKPENGYPDKFFWFLQETGIGFCKENGFCFDAVRNTHWILIALLAYLLNWFAEAKLGAGDDSCNNDDNGPPAPGPANPPGRSRGQTGNSRRRCAQSPTLRDVRNTINTTVTQNMTTFVQDLSRTLCQQCQDQATRVIDHLRRSG